RVAFPDHAGAARRARDHRRGAAVSSLSLPPSLSGAADTLTADMPRIDIAVIGAGFTGTLLAWHLGEAGLDSILIGEGESFGRGRAYSTSRMEHLLNVPAGGMSAFPDDPDHFLGWLRDAGHDFHATDFVPRRIYGRYLQSISAESKTPKLADVVASARV